MLTLDAAHTASASFALRSFLVSASATGTGTGILRGELAGTSIIDCGATGTDCSESVPYGSVITFTARPAANSYFASWGGACAGVQAASCTLPITVGASVSATFAPLPTLTVRVIATVSPPGDVTVTSSPPPGISCTNNATAEVVCSAVYAAGTVIQLTATPDDDLAYGFNGWGGACSGTSETCTVTLSSDLDVSADFYGVIF